MFHFRSLNCIGYPCENVEHHSPIIRTHNLCWVLSNIDLHSIDNSIHKVQENKSVYEESKLKSDLSFRLYTAINRYLLLPWQNVVSLIAIGNIASFGPKQCVEVHTFTAFDVV